MSDTELLPKSNVEPVRRPEVFSGTGQRRSWTAEQKAQILAEACARGESVSAVARRHGLTPQQLFGWRRNARQAARVRSGAGSAAFVPLVVEAAQPGVSMPLVAMHPVIEVVVGAATVRIARGIDAETLQTVLHAVRAAT
jgi:transposase